MQFDPERYPTVDMKFIPTAALGIIAREHEQQQFIALLQTLGPNTPVLPIILKGIMANSSLSNRFELIEMLDKMSQVDPQAQQAAQMQQQMAMQLAQAQIAVQTTQAEQKQRSTLKSQRHQLFTSQFRPRRDMKKIDPSLVVEIFGVVLVTVGIAAFSLPLAAIALGSFLVWATEKASK